jgi:hypothetical protein
VDGRGAELGEEEEAIMDSFGTLNGFALRLDSNLYIQN